MRYVMIAGVLAVLATQAQAESKTYRTELVSEKSLQACSSWGRTYTVDVSDGVLTLGINYARTLFSEPVESNGKIAKKFKDPANRLMEFVGLGNGAYELSDVAIACRYRLVPTAGKAPWNS